MTELANNLYDEAYHQFEEYPYGTLELDVLDNLLDLLRIVPDEFLRLFKLTYNTDTEECEPDPYEENAPNRMYEYPQIFFNMAHTSAYVPINEDCDDEVNQPYFEIDCCGYRLKDNTCFGCTPNHDNTSVSEEFYEDFCRRYDLQF